MTKMEEICSVSFVGHEAASELLREFTGKEGGLATVDWYLLRNKIADAISMARVDEREKCRQLLSEAEKREKDARRVALEEAVKSAGSAFDPESMCPITESQAQGRAVGSINRILAALQSEER